MKDSKVLKSPIHFLKSLVSRTQVSYLIFYVTNRCNFRCDFCFYHSKVVMGRKADELTLEEISQISSKLGPLIQLSLTGGEPFLRDDLAQITSIFIENNFVKYLTIPTNASLTQRMVTFLEYVLPLYPRTYFRIPFSIDGIGEVHDAIRNSPGSYKKIQQSYQALSQIRDRYPNLVLDANSVFTGRNQNSILATLQHIQREFDFDNISVTYARGDIKDPELKKSDFKKYLEINDYLEKLARKKEERAFYPVWRAVRDVSREYLIRTVLDNEFISPCTAGRKLLIIQENGEVYPCEILEESMGNLRDYDFDLKQLLSTPANQELLNRIERSKCKCTFECALAANVIWGKSAYLKLLKSAIRNIGKKHDQQAKH